MERAKYIRPVKKVEKARGIKKTGASAVRKKR